MAIYLVQHGKSLPKDQDPQKGLSPIGMEEVGRIAKVAAQYAIQVSSIVHSGKHRAAQTAQIFADYLQPSRGVRSVEGIDPLDDVTVFAQNVDMAGQHMIVGHLPFMEKLIAYLITGQTDKPVFRIQNGGIVCLDYYPESTNVVIKWALMPNVG